MPIIALLEFTVRPDAMDDAPRVIHETLQATRAFDGCQGVEVTFDETEPTHVLLVERWESMEHDAAYRAFRATPDGASSLGTIVVAPPVLSHYRIDADI
ncbi:putative quinol monooxygenase [Curtobacterium ammoniigenes]|uniref:putative quinol monooxygenase n=1 Tax=Curtobacterium ammoniigenes TaxID=395387 RepID=UPI00082F28E5|nr:antibiotic biosynthesis monooxygenase [Curtobacterium ammoniigenes]